jgi:8-oxo-dGTP pyrophosphatase MutT (NUDIX family)
MDVFLQWLSNNPLIAIALFITIILVVLVIVFMYLTAYIQGRRVAFWPPSIGERAAATEENKHANTSTTVRANTRSFFLKTEELEAAESIIEVIRKSDDLLIGGVALGFAAQRHRQQLQDQLDRGSKMRFLLLNPDSPDVANIATMIEISPDQIRNDILATLRNLEHLIQRSKQTNIGSIEVRLMTHEPSFSFTISNSKTKDGVIRASLRVYGYSSSTRPNWILRPNDNWFHLFVESCESLWVASLPWAQTVSKPIVRKAGVVVYRPLTQSDVEVLLITARVNPNNWIFPVGNVDPGESVQQAAARECAEESGFAVEVGPKIGSIETENSESINQMTFFIAKVTGELANYEVDRQRKWVPSSKLLNTITADFLPIARAAIAKLSS